MNDSLRTDVFVRFSPEIIACACIFLAARVVKVSGNVISPFLLNVFSAQEKFKHCERNNIFIFVVV